MNNMKSIILNGSPFRNSHTGRLIDEFSKNLNSEIEVINSYKLNISPCIDCKQCFKKPGCSIKDDMTSVYEKIEESDALIIATPMHFGIVSAPLFTLFSRLQSYWAYKHGFRDIPDNIRKKYGALLVTTGGKWVNMESLVESVADFAFDHTNTKSIGSVFAYQTDSHPVAENEEALSQARYLSSVLDDLMHGDYGF